jgi:hypothetical protein
VHDDLKNEGGLWGGIKRFAKTIVENFPYIDDIARIAGLASGVLGLLSLIPPLAPVLAPAAAIAGGISFLANSTLAAAGEQGWGPAIWDAVGLAAFGVGRLMTVASKAQAGRELATQAADLKELRLLSQGKIEPFKMLTPLGTSKLHTTARHIKQTSGLFGRAAQPFLRAGGRPIGNWTMLGRTAAFWKHAALPGRAILDVAPRAAALARWSYVPMVGGIILDGRDIATDPGVQKLWQDDQPAPANRTAGPSSRPGSQ